MLLQALRAKLAQLHDQAKALRAKAEAENRDLTEDELKQVESIDSQFQATQKQIWAIERVDEQAQYLTTSRGRVTVPSEPGQTGLDAGTPADPPRIVIPSRVRRPGQMRAFRGPDAHTHAYKFGMWFMGISGVPFAQRWCAKHGLAMNWQVMPDDDAQAAGHVEKDNLKGGFLVPEEIDNEMIDLRVQYGVIRQYARYVPMGSDTKSRPRRTGGLTAYPVGEQGAGTQSEKGWDRVLLTARKWMVLTKISSEMDEDAIIMLGDDLASEIQYAFAYAQDNAGFNGDGKSTYNGIVGIRTKLGTINGVDDGGGLVLAAGNAYSEITLANLNAVVGRLPTYARAGAAWFCSPLFYNSVMERLLTAAGGNTVTQLQDGTIVRRFLAYPVVETEVMPVAEANSQIPVIFGDLRLAVDLGERRGTTIATSDSATLPGDTNSVFATDERAIRGTTRFDINAHDLGTADAAGPVVGLILAAA